MGAYALASFAPLSQARRVYRGSWVLWGVFLVIAYLQKSSSRPMSLRGGDGPELTTLIAWLIAGIALSFVGGMMWARRQDQLEGELGTSRELP